MHGYRRSRVGGFSSGFRYPPRDLHRVGELESSSQERWGTFRTRLEQVPRFDGTRNPPNPKFGGSGGRLVPTSGNLEKVESSHGETCVVDEKAGPDDIEKHAR